MKGGPQGVAIIGCGRMGRRRAEVAAGHPRSEVRAVADPDPAARDALASATGAAAHEDWRAAVEADGVAIVVVATPNAHLAAVAEAALGAGRHVLMEKPMGRGLREAERIAAAAAGADALLKVGFNHRYHPALERALSLLRAGDFGRVLHILARYGHGGRPGLEREWRASPELAGGGHLLDQGVHLADLIHGAAGLPAEAVAFLRTAFWPIAPLEDNAYAMYRYADGAVAQLQVSMTQWKNRFSFEIFTDAGALSVEGLGGSYGTERLIVTRRRPEGGVPEVEEAEYPGPDVSWALEWDDFTAAIAADGPLRHGAPDDGLAAMRMIDALYRSAEAGGVVGV